MPEKMYKTLNKRKILILGGSSDIGFEVIKAFLNDNWVVYAQYNSNYNFKKKFERKSFKSFKLNFLDNIKKIEKDVKKIKKIHFDAFLNLTGYIDNKTFEEFTIEDMLNTLKVNTVVPLYIMKNIVNSMVKNNFGRVLLTSSIGTKFGGGAKTFNYSVSKKANEFIPKNFKEWAKKNVLINSLIIGATNTKIHNKISNKSKAKREKLIPMSRMAEPKEIADYIFYLLSEKNTFITGQVMSISGGE